MVPRFCGSQCYGNVSFVGIWRVFEQRVRHTPLTRSNQCSALDQCPGQGVRLESDHPPVEIRVGP